MLNQQNNSPMFKLASFIVKYRIWFGILFAALAVFSVFSMNWVYIEEDITQFLPDNAESKQAIEVLTDEFNIYSTAQVIVENTTSDTVEKLTEKVAEIEHVVSVDYDPIDDFKENTAYFEVSLDLLQNDEKTDKVIDNIKKAMGGAEACVYCDVGFTDSDVIDAEMTTVLIIFFVILLAVLLLSSQTYAEVLVLLITLGASALINMGTHFIFGTISLIAEAVSVVMQLALSIDYAIIFCNRYKEERETGDKREAVVNALSASIPAIFSSSLTTIAGLVAMTLMTFRLGGDLGSVLIKAIIISLLSVFLLMPVLLYWFDGLIMRTKHRKFIPNMAKLGNFSFVTRKIMPILFAIVLVCGGILVNKTTYSYNYVYTTAFNEAEEDRALRIAETLFQKNNYIVLLPSGNYKAEKAMLDELNKWDEVKEAVGLANTEIADGVYLCDDVDYKTVCELAEVDDEIGQALFAYYAADCDDHNLIIEQGIENYKAPLIDVFTFLHDNCIGRDDLGFEIDKETIDTVNELYEELEFGMSQSQSNYHSAISVSTTMPPQGEEVTEFVAKVHKLADKQYGDKSGEVLLYGDSMFYRDFETSFKTDNVLVSTLSILFVLIILFFTFKSAVLSVLLIAVIQGSIWINFSIPVLTGGYVYFACFLIVSAIQMGSNIDYAIVMSSRYLELRKTKEKSEAIKDAVALAFPTVITSGLLMACAGLLMYLRVSENITANMGKFICIGAVITMVLVLFVLPQLLLLFDTPISKTTIAFAPKSGNGDKPSIYRRLTAALLAVISVASMALLPICTNNQRKTLYDKKTLCEKALKKAEEARSSFEAFAGKQKTYDDAKYTFAESYMIDLVGTKELAAGQKEYDDGKKQLDDGEQEFSKYKKLYEDGLKEYEEGKSQYDDGMRQYQSGKKEYEDGKKEYEEGKKEYESGKKEYEAGKKAYEEGLKAYEEGKKAYEKGLKEYEEGLAEYNAAKAEFDEMTELYNTVKPYYDEYLGLKQQGGGSDISSRAYYALLRLVFESDLSNIASIISTDQSIVDALKEYKTITNLINAYQEAEQQLKEAEQELRAGEKELAEGKKQLEDGEKELAEGKKQLEEAEKLLKDGEKELKDAEGQLKDAEKELEDAEGQLKDGEEELEAGKKELEDGEKELKDAEKQISDGKKELADGEKELEEAKKYLAENKQKLQDSIKTLDEYVKEHDEITALKTDILSDDQLKQELSDASDDIAMLKEAKAYYKKLQKQTERELLLCRLRHIFLMLAALLLFVYAILLIFFKAAVLRKILIIAVIVLLIAAGVTLII